MLTNLLTNDLTNYMLKYKQKNIAIFSKVYLINPLLTRIIPLRLFFALLCENDNFMVKYQ